MIKRIAEKLSSLSSNLSVRRIFIVILIGILIHGILIVFDLTLRTEVLNYFQASGNEDIKIYRERVETILNRGLLYRDVHTETPPLINYLLTVPAIFSDSSLAFEVYFSIFNILTAILIYQIFKKWIELKAFHCALLFLTHPLVFHVATLARQDEPVATFFFLLPACIMLINKDNFAALLIGVGIWIKMYPILLIPTLLIKAKTLKLRIKYIAIIAVTSLVIILPFLILCVNDFLSFLKYYFLGGGGETVDAHLQGMSLWRFVNLAFSETTREIHMEILLVIILVVALLIFYAYLLRRQKHNKKFSAWKISTLTLLIFFIFYPKIHVSYYLMVIGLLLPYALTNNKILYTFYSLSAVIGILGMYEYEVFSSYGWDMQHLNSTSIGLIISIAIIVEILQIYLFYRVIKVEGFFEKETEGNDALHSSASNLQ